MNIELQDNLGNALCSWDLQECWPSEWMVNEFDGKSNNVVVDDLALLPTLTTM